MTIFEKIAAGELPSHTIYEDSEFMAILDKFPVKKAQALVFPKKAYSSKFSEVPPSILSTAVQIAKVIAQKIENNIEDVARVILVIEGFEIDHFHVKLIPIYHPNPHEQTPTHSMEKVEFTERELKEICSKINK